MSLENPLSKYESKPVSPQLNQKVLRQAQQQISPSLGAVLLKYAVLFAMTVFISLLICPQRGVGLASFGTDITHHLMHQSEALCGLYCGLMFFLTTHLLSFFLLNHYERLKMVRHLGYLPPILMSAFFGLSMMSSFSNFNGAYVLSWLTVVVLSYGVTHSVYLIRWKA